MNFKPETTTKLYAELVPGDRFYSPRADEGLVTVVCAPGACTHDERDAFSTHVRSRAFGTEFFVLHFPSKEVDVLV